MKLYDGGKDGYIVEGDSKIKSNYFYQTVPNDQFINPNNTTLTWSTGVVSFSKYHFSNDVTIHSEDIDMSSIIVEKTDKLIGIQILANGLVENDIKVYTLDGKLVVEFLEEEQEPYEREIILEGFQQPCGKVEFDFSNLYDYGSPKVDLILGILFISVSKFEEFLKKDIQIGNF